MPSGDSEPDILVLAASARTDGNLMAAAGRLCDGLGVRASLVDLSSLTIAPFSYRRREEDDDFRDVVERMAACRSIVFATPVYWYAMSGVLKTFFDRLTDLLIGDGGRPLARKLAGRDVWLLATGADPRLPAGFHEPFALTADYLGMRWRAACYVRSPGGARPREQELAHCDRLAARIAG